ncbi:neutral zinc metallopeptidase [uncultured Flavobacterium sp.]|uniref:KPN_02809 family neutral zinc metallopeptidase n=1 Tax=uncultured Flavobacterium sp. TaxID=165435 RepID=UPI0025DCDD71|nr:neutral zinc metallopeptidase [uncultured Flavobacterium sp.]
MKWGGRRSSGNLDDRRGMSGGGMVAGGGIVGAIVLVIYMFMGGDSGAVMEQMQQMGSGSGEPVELTEKDKELGQMVDAILVDTEDVWHKIFEENGLAYEEPTLVLFRNSVQTQCGGATSASGPFYCPADRKVYMDLAFFDELQSRYGAKGGDFAIAYVIAHEVGHHVQTLLGTSQKVTRLQQQTGSKEANQLSVALELQADFYAGLWTHYNQEMKDFLEAGDIEEALSAANAVGDDALQKGNVVPDSFTHGTSAQRMYWFKKGFESGDFKQGDTFSELNLDF